MTITRYGESTFVPTKPAARAAWQQTMRKIQRNASADLEDLPKLIALWRERFGLDTVICCGDLVKLALPLGLCPHALRRSKFAVRSARLAYLLEAARARSRVFDGAKVALGGRDGRVRSRWRLVAA